MTQDVEPATLIYDGECSVCRQAARWVKFYARSGEIETLPCQSDDRKRRFPNMDQAKCLEAMQLVLPNGEVYSGEQALPYLFRRMHGWRWIAGVFNLPLINRISPKLYRAVANHRHRLTGFLRLKRGKTKCHSKDQGCKD